jgi:hypothetical protein
MSFGFSLMYHSKANQPNEKIVITIGCGTTHSVTFINLGIVIHNVQYLVPVAAGVVYVNIIKAGLPDDAEQLAKLDEKRSEEGNIQIEFGSIHGSVYTAERGHCTLPSM